MWGFHFKDDPKVWMTATLPGRGPPRGGDGGFFREVRRFEERLFDVEKYLGKVGAVEGAVYEARGYYRPEVDCIMFTRSQAFCTVCRRAIARVIDLYTRRP